MNCSKCNTANPADAIYCGNCGGRLVAAATVDLANMRTIDPSATIAPTPSRGGPPMKAGEMFGGRYEIRAVIGEGGMGVVYRAFDNLAKREVALKLIRSELLSGADAVGRLIAEGVLARDIRHPNVVAVYDVAEANGQPFMSMECLTGQSMRGWLHGKRQQREEIPFRVAARVVLSILDGLEAAHKAGVVHRDLKPENVTLLSDPTADAADLKLLDFGIARAAGGRGTGTQMMGSIEYMAPEQVSAPDTVTPAADFYSLSRMFYEMLVGSLPMGHWQPPSGGRSDVPQSIDKLIEKGLANNDRLRPQTAADYRSVVVAALAGTRQTGESSTGDRVRNIQNTIKNELNIDLSKLAPKDPDNIIRKQIDAAKERVEQTSAELEATGNLSLMKWFQYSLTKRYADFKGRSHRKEYWSFFLWSVIIFFIAGFIDGFMIASGEATETTMIYIATILLICPSAAITARRFHDIGQSGWLTLLCAIPGIGQLGSIVLGFIEGNKGDNAYGPDPLGRGN